MSMDPYKIILRPVITEKSTVLKEKNRDVAFEVAMSANKSEIKKAVEQLFKIKVDGVRIQIKTGKERRMGRHSRHSGRWHHSEPKCPSVRHCAPCHSTTASALAP